MIASTISAWPQTTAVAAALAAGFQQDVFAAAIKSFEQRDNPLRLNNLATGLRELIRIVLHDFAPDQAVMSCSWYVKDLGGSITRGQRIKYAVQAGLPDGFVCHALGIDVDTTVGEFSKLSKVLNKLTHVSPATFGIPDAAADQLAVEALETFGLLYQTIADCRAEVEEAAEERAREMLNDELTSNVVQELDSLATHYTFWGVDIDSVDITLLNATRMEIQVDGFVNCEFQYGSSSDVRNDVGEVCDDSYPFSCRFTSASAVPMELHITPGTLDIDTNSFYE